MRVIETSSKISTVETRIEFLPDCMWALHRFVREGTSHRLDGSEPYAFRKEILCSYDPDFATTPILTRCERTEWHAAQPDLTALKPVKRYLARFLRVEPGTPPATVFEIDQILGRQRLVVPERRGAGGGVLLLKGVAPFLIGGFFSPGGAGKKRLLVWLAPSPPPIGRVALLPKG